MFYTDYGSVYHLSEQCKYLDIINIADDNQSASYDLHKDTSVNGRNMLRGTVMEQLVTLKADGSIAPELCESYDVSDDNSAFTFHLHQGVKFHNGKEMTSADVVASLISSSSSSTSPTKITPTGCSFAFSLNWFRYVST